MQEARPEAAEERKSRILEEISRPKQKHGNTTQKSPFGKKTGVKTFATGSSNSNGTIYS